MHTLADRSEEKGKPSVDYSLLFGTISQGTFVFHSVLRMKAVMLIK